MRYSFQDRPVSKFGPPIWNCDKSHFSQLPCIRRHNSVISQPITMKFGTHTGGAAGEVCHLWLPCCICYYVFSDWALLIMWRGHIVFGATKWTLTDDLDLHNYGTTIAWNDHIRYRNQFLKVSSKSGWLIVDLCTIHVKLWHHVCPKTIWRNLIIVSLIHVCAWMYSM